MSDHIEHKCSWCGSLLHHVEDCPECSKASNAPRTDAARKRALGQYQVLYPSNKARPVNDLDMAELERENNQLCAELKQCAEALDMIFTEPSIEDKYPNGDIKGYSFRNHSGACRTLKKALSLPSVQAALKEKEKEKEKEQ